MKKYKITCLKCKKEAFVQISEDNSIFFEGGVNTNLLSGRWRKSLDWGWECICGNDNRVSSQELKDIKELVNGTPQQISEIVKGLNVPDNKQFRMVGV